MGTHGHGCFRGAIVGSVTHNVVRYAPVPVLAQKLRLIEPLGKEECNFVCQRVFYRLLAPTDFSPSAEKSLSMVKRLAPTGVEEIVVLHVQDVRLLRPHLDHKIEEFNRIDTERLEQIQRELAFSGLKTRVLLREGVPFQEIDRVARPRRRCFADSHQFEREDCSNRRAARQCFRRGYLSAPTPCAGRATSKGHIGVAEERSLARIWVSPEKTFSP